MESDPPARADDQDVDRAERDDDHEPDTGERAESFVPADAEGPVVYLVEGQQLAYGTKVAWDEATR